MFGIIMDQDWSWDEARSWSKNVLILVLLAAAFKNTNLVNLSFLTIHFIALDTTRMEGMRFALFWREWLESRIAEWLLRTLMLKKYLWVWMQLPDRYTSWYLPFVKFLSNCCVWFIRQISGRLLSKFKRGRTLRVTWGRGYNCLAKGGNFRDFLQPFSFVCLSVVIETILSKW